MSSNRTLRAPSLDADRREWLRRSSTTVTAFAIAPLISVLAGCGKSDGSGSAKLGANAASESSSAPTSKVYAIATDASYAPFESQDDKGDFVGFEIELMQAAAKAIGLEVEFINTPWEGLVPALEQGDLDAAISVIAPSEELAKALDFTTSYFDAEQALVVSVASGAQQLRDLKPARVGIQEDSSADELVKAAFGKNAPMVQRFESIPEALAELEAGNLDGVLADNGVLAHYVTHNGSTAYRFLRQADSEHERYAIAVKKGNKELLDKLNQGLAAMRQDGSFAALHKRYFGSLPLPATMAALPAAK